MATLVGTAARADGATPRFIPFDCAPEDFGEHFDPRTRMVVINNPNNPAGRLYGRDELIEIHRLCCDAGACLLVDEAYSDFIVDEPFHSVAELVPDKEGVIVVNSLSKNMGLSGWRVGYVITNPGYLAALLKLNQHLLTCAPSILLYYLARYFDRIVAITLPQVQAVVEKRRRVAAMIDGLGLRRLEGEATFYFFVSIGDFPATSLDFALHLLLDHGIAVVPGTAYGASTERFIRLSIGTESEERIYESLLVIRDVVRAKTFDMNRIERKLGTLGLKAFEMPESFTAPT